MQRLGPTKRRKRKSSECVDCFGHWTIFMRWTESGLCIRGGWLRADPQRSQFCPTNLFLSFNLWCKDLVPQKRGKGKAVSVLIVLATDCLFALNRGRLCTRDGWLRIDPQQGQFHPTNLFLGLNLWCKDLSYKKEEKETKWACWMFRPLDCLYALNREWTLYERWVTESWLLMLSVSPNKSLF